MNVVVNLLESIASNATFKYIQFAQLEEILNDEKILSNLQINDVRALELKLGARTNLVCGVMPAEQFN